MGFNRVDWREISVFILSRAIVYTERCIHIEKKKREEDTTNKPFLFEREENFDKVKVDSITAKSIYLSTFLSKIFPSLSILYTWGLPVAISIDGVFSLCHSATSHFEHTHSGKTIKDNQTKEHTAYWHSSQDKQIKICLKQFPSFHSYFYQSYYNLNRESSYRESFHFRQFYKHKEFQWRAPY